MATPNDVAIDLLIDGAWVDAVATGDGVLVRDEVQIRTGRSNWAGRTDPSRAGFTLADRDGRWSPDNTGGAYYGNFRRNIPARIGVKGKGDPYLAHNGTSADLASTPDIAGTGGGSPTSPTVASVTPTTITSFSTTHTYDLPVTVNVGDRLVVNANIGHSSATPTSSLDDWTEIASDNRHTFDGRRVYEIDVTTSDLATELADGTIAFTTLNSVKSSATVAKITGARSGGEGVGYDIQVDGWDADQITGPDPATVTASWGSEPTLYVGLLTADNSSTTLDVSGVPAGYTAEGDTGNNSDHGFITAIASLEETSASDDPGVWTLDAAAWVSTATIVYRAAEDASSDGVLDIAGDIEMRIDIQLLEDMVDLNEGGSRVRLAHKSSGINGWEFEAFKLGDNVHVGFTWYDSGSTFHRYETRGLEGEVPHEIQYRRIALRVTLDVDNGASDSEAAFYYHLGGDGLDPAGGWTLIGIDSGEGTTSIRTNDAPLRVAGNPADGSHIPAGKTFAYRLYNSAGTVVADPDFEAQAIGATSWADSAGRTWTIGAGGDIIDTRWRFHGELASIPTRWNVDGSDVWAPVEAAGIFRRLRQGPRRLESAIRRGILRDATDVVQYWPCEEAGTATSRITRFGAAVGTNPIVVTNAVPDTAANTAFLASDPLATFGDSIWTVDVDDYEATGAWQLRWLQSIPDDATGSDNHYLVLQTSDCNWHVRWRDTAGGDLEVIAYRGGAVVYQTGWVSFVSTGTNWRMSLSVVQNGGDVDVRIEAEDPAAGTVGGYSETAAVAADPGVVERIQFNKDTDIDGWSIGHITLQSAETALSTLAAEVSAHAGETAANRIIRLCQEEGIPTRVQGDPATSQAMGPQRANTLMGLLEECADTDLGVLFEPRETVAVGYRTRLSMTGQDVQIDLDYAAGELAGSPDLDRDDSDFGNDVTVENWSGATARAQLDDGSAMSVSQPPVGAGRYDATFQVVALDEDLVELAQLRLDLSAVDEPRVSRLRLGLHYPEISGDSVLLGSILDSQLGDLLAVANVLSAALAGGTIRQLVQGVSERIGSHTHTLDLLTSPASPWLALPAAIDDLTATPGNSEVLLTWSPPANEGGDITSYDVERSATSASAGFAALATDIDPAGSYTDTAVTNGTQYWWRVRATNSAGDAPWSNVVTATPSEAPDPPAAVTDLAATGGDQQIDLAWTAPASTETITGYDIHRSTVGADGPWTTVEDDLAPATSYNDSGLAVGTEYWYRIRAASSEGDGPWSNVDSAITDTGPPAVGSTQGTGFSSSSTWGVVQPATVNSTDRLLVLLAMSDPAGDPSASASGWTSRHLTNMSTSNGGIQVLEKDTVTGSEDGTTVNFTLSPASAGAAIAFTVTGGHATSIAFGTTAEFNGNNSPNPPSLTSGFGAVDTLWLALAAARDDDATISSWPANYTHAQVSQVSGAGTNAGGTAALAARQLSAATEDPGTYTLSESEEWLAATMAIPTSGSSGGSTPGGTPAPTIPAFSVDTTITAGQDVKAIIEAAAEGTHFLLASGTHNNCENVKLKTDQHVRLAPGCILEGAGKGYCFRPADQSVTGVAIGGDPTGTRPIIRNYGGGSSSQGFGAIMGRTDDTLNLYPSEPGFVFRDVDDWFIYHVDLHGNSSQGIKLGSNWTVYDVESHDHTVAGINGDRIVGGLIHSCLLYHNALNPATGAGANGANIKVTWVNGDAGRTDQTPIDRTKAQFVVSNCTFEALDRNGGPGDTNTGMWFDLDCKNCLVEHSTFDDHPSRAIYVEGCNDVEVSNNTVRNSAGYGAAFNDDFIAGAIIIAESTNCDVHDNNLTDCGRTLVNRMSNRSADWYNSNDGSGVNYAWSSGPRYWILDTGRGSTPSSTAQSNMWTGGNTFQDNTLINCDRVLINEGTNGGGMTAQGATPNDLVFTGNDYSGSSGIEFYDKSNTALTLGQWQALGYDT